MRRRTRDHPGAHAAPGGCYDGPMPKDDETGLTPFPRGPAMIRGAVVAAAVSIGALGCGGGEDDDAGVAAPMVDAGMQAPMVPFDAGGGDAGSSDMDAGPDGMDGGDDAGMMAPMVDAMVPLDAPMPIQDAGRDSGNVIAPMPPPTDAGPADAGNDAGNVVPPMPPPMPPPPMPAPK